MKEESANNPTGEKVLSILDKDQVRQHSRVGDEKYRVKRLPRYWGGGRSITYWCIILSLWGVAGRTCAEPKAIPYPSPSPTPVSISEPTPVPESASAQDPLPSPSSGVDEAPVPLGTTPSEPESPSLFRSAVDDEQSQVDKARKVRADALLRAASTQATADVLSRATFGRAETNAEVLFNGIGGVPQALNPLYAAAGLNSSQGYQLGPFAIHPILSTGVTYGTTSGNNGSSGFYGSLSPAFTLTVGEPATGRTISMQYTGSLTYGANSAGQEAYNQSFSANGTFNFVKLNLGFGLDFSQLSGSDRDYGGQNVSRQIIGLTLSSGYTYSEKTSLTASLSAPIRLFGRGSSSGGVNATGFVNYAYSPLTTVGVGFGLGTLQVEGGTSQLFEQALFKLTYLLTTKLSFSGTVGYEFLDAGSKEQITPTFGLGFAWNIREGTTVSISGERRILNSAALTEVNYTDTSVSLSVTQRLGNFIQLTGTVGYENAEYTGVEQGISSSRSDNQLILQGGISYRFANRWIVTGSVSYNKNFSSQAAFESSQNSLQLSYVF